jgi:hypothetical protein
MIELFLKREEWADEFFESPEYRQRTLDRAPTIDIRGPSRLTLIILKEECLETVISARSAVAAPIMGLHIAEAHIMPAKSFFSADTANDFSRAKHQALPVLGTRAEHADRARNMRASVVEDRILQFDVVA